MGSEAWTILDLEAWRASLRSPLTIRMAEPLGVALNGRQVQFATRHAECAVLMLALKGDEGITSYDLGMRMWPDAPQHKRAPRLRTMLWQVRKALGDQSWRVERQGPVVVLDMEDADLVVGPGSDQVVLDEEILASRLLRALGRRGRPQTPPGTRSASSSP